MIAEQAVDSTRIDDSKARNVIIRTPVEKLNCRVVQKLFGDICDNDCNTLARGLKHNVCDAYVARVAGGYVVRNAIQCK